MNVTNENVQSTIPPRIIELRTRLETWLDKKAWDFDELRQMLKGYSLPSLGRDEEPYSWVLRGLEDLNNSFTQEMAKRISCFLKEIKPNQYIQERDDKKFLYNLFNICAGLRCKTELAEPLKKVFLYFQAERNEEEINEIFADKRFYDIEGAFREALIVNQVDKTYMPVWKSILENRMEFLSTPNAFNGFRGVLFISDNNKPAVDEIGWALGKMAEYLFEIDDKKRHEKFRRLLERVKEVWSPDKFLHDWDEILFRQAIKHEWQDWAIVRLNKLVMPIGEVVNETQRFFIWEIYLPFLEELKIDFRIISRQEILLEIEASQEAALFLEKTSEKIEINRKHSSNKSYEGVKLTSNEAFNKWVDELKLDGNMETAKAIERARFRVLTSKLPASQQQTATETLAKAAAS